MTTEIERQIERDNLRELENLSAKLAAAEATLAAMTARAEKAEAEWDRWESRAEDKRLSLIAAQARAERLAEACKFALTKLPYPGEYDDEREVVLQLRSALAETGSGEPINVAGMDSIWRHLDKASGEPKA